MIEIKRGDKIIIFVLCAVTAISATVLYTFKRKAHTVTVKQNNETVYEASISKDKIINLSGNTVVIKNGEVKISKADCKNQICVHHKKISKSGESIVCLPNRVIVSVD